MKIFSPAFDNGREVPKRYTQEGENISPPIEWTAIPPNTKELVLICEDPDAPRDTPYIHWVIYGIDPKIWALPEGIRAQTEVENIPGAVQGNNSAGKIGYVGPMPPRGDGPHRYFFKLYALDQKLNLRAGYSSEQLVDRIRNHILEEAEMIGRYERAADRQTSAEAPI